MKTAMQQDIDRRERELKKMSKELSSLRNTHDHAKTKTQKDREIFLSQYCLELLKDINKSKKIRDKVEKEQIIEARQDGHDSTYAAYEEVSHVYLEGSHEQYYNETYVNENT